MGRSRHDPPLDELGAMLREARGQETQDELAVRIGIAQGHLSAIERGAVVPRFGKLILLSRGLGLDLAQLAVAAAVRASRIVDQQEQEHPLAS